MGNGWDSTIRETDRLRGRQSKFFPGTRWQGIEGVGIIWHQEIVENGWRRVVVMAHPTEVGC